MNNNKMKMNKKWIVMGAGIGIGAVMLTVSGLSAMAGTSGYDAWKAAVKQTHAAKSFVVEANVAVSEAGTKLIEAQTVFKKDEAAASVEARLSAGSESHGMNVYVRDGQTILKPSDSDVYRVAEHGADEDGWHGPKRGSEHAPDPAMAERMERVFDALVGNLKDRATLAEHGDGSKQVALSLTGSQVPVAVQAIGSLLIGHAGSAAPGWAQDHGKDNEAVGTGPLLASDLMQKLPKLTQDIRIDAIQLAATIDADHLLDDQSAEIQISGKDAAGVAHTVVIEMKLDFANINATSADTVDLSGKTVEPIEQQEWSRKRDGR